MERDTYTDAQNVKDIEGKLLTCAAECTTQREKKKERPWSLDVLKALWERRGLASSASERRTISKLIRRETRKKLRQHKTEQARKTLTIFANIANLSYVHALPVSRQKAASPDHVACSEYLSRIYKDPERVCSDSPQGGFSSPPFTLAEVKNAIQRVVRKRAQTMVES